MGLLAQAQLSLLNYNQTCIHYNLVAAGVYQARLKFGAQSTEYAPYIVAGLCGFDMRRQMGNGNPYSTNGFAGRLLKRLSSLKETLCTLPSEHKLGTADFQGHSKAIKHLYRSFADPELGQGRRFDVGATKILHWLYPDLFLMLDRNAATAFRDHLNVPFSRGTQPGYSPETYLRCLQFAQKEIVGYGREDFSALEAGTPIGRIFDKIAFIVGMTHQ